MNKFTDYLIDKGYKPFERNVTKEGKVEYVKPRSYFSSMGMVSLVYVKGDKEIRVGLSEKGLPPTLMHPRPRMYSKKETILEDGTLLNGIYAQNSDKWMNRVLQNENVEDIYKALFDRSIKFNIDYD